MFGVEMGLLMHYSGVKRSGLWTLSLGKAKRLSWTELAVVEMLDSI
jgi:hypothetical protein